MKFLKFLIRSLLFTQLLFLFSLTFASQISWTQLEGANEYQKELLTKMPPYTVLWWLDKDRTNFEKASFIDDAGLKFQPLNVTELSPKTVKNCYAVIIDNSRSMRKHWENVQIVADELLSKIPKNDIVYLSVFADNATNLIRTGQVKNLTISDLKISEKLKIDDESKKTQFFFVVDNQIDTLKTCPAILRHIIILSDGDAEDDNQAYNLSDMVTKTNSQQIKIHSVGFGKPQSLKLKILRRFSKETNGAFTVYDTALNDNALNLQSYFSNIFDKHKLFGLVSPDLSALTYKTEQLQLHLSFVTGIVATSGSAATSDIVATSGTVATSDIVATSGAVGTISQQTITPQSSFQSGENIEFNFNIPVAGTSSFAHLYNTIKLKYENIAISVLSAILILLILLAWSRSRKKRKKLKQNQQQKQVDEAKHQDLLKQQEDIKRKLADIKNKDEKLADHADTYAWFMIKGGKKYPIYKYSMTIGSLPENDIVIDDPTVSRQHAIFDFKKGKFFWTERNPANPTKVNGKAINNGQANLNHEDVITCGMTEMTFAIKT